MYSLTITNASGHSITLTQNGNYEVAAIAGLTPGAAVINHSPIGGADGAVFNSARIHTRNIVFTIVPNAPVEENRIRLYQLFPIKSRVRIEFSNGVRDVMIEGYVESVEGDLFALRQSLQVSVLCLQPYFKSAGEIVNELSQILKLFEFPFQTEYEGIVFSEIDQTSECVVRNLGEAETGVIIEITANGNVSNPIIYNANDLTSFGIDYDIGIGDVVTINTNQSQKSVTLFRDGVTHNLINYLDDNPTWFRLGVGETVFSYNAEIGAEWMVIRFRHYDMFEGV